MKYRTDFVTNSSSSSFAAAAITTLAGILASCNCKEAEETENPDQENPGDDSFFMQKTMMPEGVEKLVSGGDSVFLYAQCCTTTEQGVVVLPDETAGITYQVSTGAGWVDVSPMEMIGDWAAVIVTGITPTNSTSAPPQKIVIKARCTHAKKKYSVIFRLPYEAEASLVIKPLKCNFLSKSGESAEFTVAIKNAGPESWLLSSPEPEFGAEKLCNFELQDISDQGDKAKLVVTECDSEETSGGSKDHYSKGKLTVRANQGDKEISDYCEVYVWREGLFRMETLDYDRETNEYLIKAEKVEGDEAGGAMKTSIFDLCYQRWNGETKTLKADTAVFSSDEFSLSDPDPKDDNAEALFETANVVIKYEGERPSNTPTGKFSVYLDKVVPGKKGERFRFTVTATVDNGLDYFEVDIPFAIVPAYLSESKGNWQQEYDYCKKIITSFFPVSKRAAKLAELEDCKHYMGVDDLKQYRKETWSIAYDIIMKQKADYDDEAAWYDWALYTAEWVQWLNDRAFNVVLGTLTGPIGAIVATQCKELAQDMIAKYVLCKSTDTWMSIVYDLLYNRFSSTLGGAIDAKYFSEPEVSYKWIGGFFMYKWAYHWAFDYENNERKGCIEGAKSAAWDLTAAGLEEKLKPFIKTMADKGNFNQSMAVDDYITKTVENLKPYLGRFISDETGSGGKA